MERDLAKADVEGTGPGLVKGLPGCSAEAGVPVIGFGGCGSNVLIAFSHYGAKGLRLSFVSGNRARNTVPENNIATYSLEDMDTLALECPKCSPCFLVGGLGGQSCAHLLALARKLHDKGVFTVALCAMPFSFEGRTDKAAAELEDLRKTAGAALPFSNDDYLKKQPANAALAEALSAISKDMYACILAMACLPDSVIHIDSMDLRACVHGLVRHGIGHAKTGSAQAGRDAFSELMEKNGMPRSRASKAALIAILEPAGPESSGENSLAWMVEGANILEGAQICIAAGCSRSTDWVAVALMSDETEGL